MGGEAPNGEDSARVMLKNSAVWATSHERVVIGSEDRAQRTRTVREHGPQDPMTDRDMDRRPDGAVLGG
jgi:hypothetical protein